MNVLYGSTLAHLLREGCNGLLPGVEIRMREIKAQQLLAEADVYSLPGGGVSVIFYLFVLEEPFLFSDNYFLLLARTIAYKFIVIAKPDKLQLTFQPF